MVHKFKSRGKVIKLNKKFKKKLSRLGVMRQYKYNSFNNFKDYVPYKVLNECQSFSDLVLGSFSWDRSPEGFDFWYNIAKSK